MTREQAIKALKWFKEYNEEDYCGGDRIQDEHGDWYYRITEQDFEAFDVAIKALEQEPRKGHWDIKGKMWWVCSACGCQTRMMKKYNVPRFCPACGADMRGDEE